jgi:streptogramin lyase
MASYDAVPANPTTPAGTQIGVGSCTMTVTAGAANVVPVVINGIAQTVYVNLPVPALRPLQKFTQNAIVSVLDADRDVIVSPSYVDSSGNAVTVSLAVLGGGSLFSVGSPSFTVPQPNGDPITYDPTNITVTQMQSSANYIVQASLSSPASATNLLVSVPAAVQTISGLGGVPYGITAQSSASTLWVTEPSANQIQGIVPSSNTVSSPTSVATPSGPIGPTPGPKDILFAPDGNLWMTFNNTGAIGKIATNGASENGTTLVTGAPGISLASDGTNVWTMQSGGPYLEYTPFTPFSVTQYNPVGSTGMFQIVAGTGGAMWYTAATANLIGYVGPVPGTGAGLSSVTLTAGATPEGIAWDGSNTMWVAEAGAGINKMAMVTGSPTSATLTEYPLGTGVVPSYVVVGIDGNAWFDYSNAGSPGVGRITPSGTVSLFPLPGTAAPGQMTAMGGQIWIVDTGSNALYGISV